MAERKERRSAYLPIGFALGAAVAYFFSSPSASDIKRADSLEQELRKSEQLVREYVDERDAQTIEIERLRTQVEELVRENERVRREYATSHTDQNTTTIVEVPSGQRESTVTKGANTSRISLRQVERLVTDGPELLYTDKASVEQQRELEGLLRSDFRSPGLSNLQQNMGRVWIERGFADGKRVYARGNGVYVTPTLMLTATHVVASWEDLLAKRKSISVEINGKRQEVSVLVANRKYELALISAPRNEQFYPVSIADGVALDSRTNFYAWRGGPALEGPFALRYAGKGAQIFGQGLGSLSYLEDADFYEGWCERGCSGSSVLSDEGKIVGVVSLGSPGIVITAPGKAVRETIEKFLKE